jgi:surface antigen
MINTQYRWREKMNKICTALITALLALSLTACQEMNNQDVGTVTGAVAGGLLGSTVGQGGGQMVAIAAGTLVGAYMGGAIGRSMDQQDQANMAHALESNNVGQPAYWRNSKTGTSYKVTPIKNVQKSGNKYCREYRTTADVAGKQQQVYGTACRQPDGSWKAVN